jgi:hypothetical protein
MALARGVALTGGLTIGAGSKAQFCKNNAASRFNEGEAASAAWHPQAAANTLRWRVPQPFAVQRPTSTANPWIGLKTG